MKAVVEVKGGFGNQIFQFAFANYLKNLGYDVKISTFHLNKTHKGITSRNLSLDVNQFSFKEVKRFNVKFLIFLNKLLASEKLKKVNNFYIGSFYSKYSKLEHFNSNNKKFLNYFDGYWQDIMLLDSQKEFIIESLKKNEMLYKAFQKPVKEGTTLLQIRRGDYLKIGENLTENFYLQALNFCKKNIKNFSYEIFTEDLNWVKNKYTFKDSLKIHPPTNKSDDQIETFSKMLNFQNYIVGNSTYSLVAAVLSETKNSIIIIPNPWFRNRESISSIKSSWIKIENSI